MGRDRRARNVPLLTALVATGVAIVLAFLHHHAFDKGLPGMAALEGFSVDARFRIRGPRNIATDRIVIVALDDKTRDVAPDVFQTRRGYARLFDALTDYTPKAIAVDLLFGSPEQILSPELSERIRTANLTGGDPSTQLLRAVADELEGDDVLADAMAKNKRLVLGAFFVQGKHTAAPEPDGLAKARHAEVADRGGGGALRPLTASYVHFSLPAFSKHALGAGAVNTLRDDDGVTRRMPLGVEHGGRHYMSLGLAMAAIEMKADTRYIVGNSSLAAGSRTLPLSPGASLTLDVLGRDRIPRVSAADLLDHTAPKAAIDGKLVFLGHTFSASDKVMTPLDPIADGVELHATLTENILTAHILTTTGWIVTLVVTALLGLIVCAAQLRSIRKRAWIPPVIAVVALLIYLGITAAMFSRGTVLPIAVPLVFTGLVLLAASIGGLATEGREKAQLRTVFSQYVSRPVVDRILADPAKAKLGGERKELTVLFSDIRGFSNFAEGMTPEALAAFLHEYLTPMTDLVLASGGTLDKYIGDAIMAIWGAPVDMTDHAARACDVALKMQESLFELNKAWTKRGKPDIAIGIGLNTGPMAVGNMGSTARFEYTVLGDQVNLGSRLEALTKEYGVGILVGESTARAAGDAFLFREIDLVRVKGRAGAAPVFELVGRAGKADPTFAKALALYRERSFDEAKRLFASLDGDAAAAIMSKRCEVLAAAPPPSDWDGVYEQRSK
jgi:adenylate cyclase